MNSLIYKFATEAGAYCETYLYGGDPKPPVLDGMDLEKFTQLIVKECADVVQYYYTRNECASGRDIKQHFGVQS